MKKCVVSVLRREPMWFPIWFDYYSRYFKPEDIYVINHSCEDDDGGEFDNYMDSMSKQHHFNLQKLIYKETFDHEWLRTVVQQKQRSLLRKYTNVLFCEIDEIIYSPKGLDNFIDNMSTDVSRCRGIEVVHHIDEEPSIDLTKPLLRQRKWCYESRIYCKSLISKIPLSWCWGFHSCVEEPSVDPDLYLIHLHKLDWEMCISRNRLHKHTLKEPKGNEPGSQNYIQDLDWLREWWELSVDGFPDKIRANHIPMPEEIADAI